MCTFHLCHACKQANIFINILSLLLLLPLHFHSIYCITLFTGYIKLWRMKCTLVVSSFLPHTSSFDPRFMSWNEVETFLWLIGSNIWSVFSYYCGKACMSCKAWVWHLTDCVCDCSVSERTHSNIYLTHSHRLLNCISYGIRWPCLIIYLYSNTYTPLPTSVYIVVV